MYDSIAKYVKEMRKQIGLTQVAMFGAEITPAKSLRYETGKGVFAYLTGIV